MSNARFVAGTDNKGFWVVTDTLTGSVRRIGSGHWGRIDAHDHADQQNRAAALAAKYAA